MGNKKLSRIDPPSRNLALNKERTYEEILSEAKKSRERQAGKEYPLERDDYGRDPREYHPIPHGYWRHYPGVGRVFHKGGLLIRDRKGRIIFCPECGMTGFIKREDDCYTCYNLKEHKSGKELDFPVNPSTKNIAYPRLNLRSS